MISSFVIWLTTLVSIMKVNVLFFSVTREVTGKTSLDLEFSDQEGKTYNLSDVLNSLYNLYPGLKDCNFKFALNKKYVKMSIEELSTYVVKDGDVVACIPPISGG